ncbi:MAG: recombinase family protein [Campylobacteraceae bacterium]|nr:recombinase family protein [Campylobacteraceae bacterium]
MNIAYIGVSKNKSDSLIQKKAIINYALKKDLCIDEYISIDLLSKKEKMDTEVHDFFTSFKEKDLLVIYEMSKLGRSTQEVLQLISKLLNKKIILHFIKEDLFINPNNTKDLRNQTIINLLGIISRLEKEVLSNRVKEALSIRKEKGLALGKPKGVNQKSKYDVHKERIVELKDLGVSLSQIINKHLKPVMESCTVQSLSTYLKRRSL